MTLSLYSPSYFFPKYEILSAQNIQELHFSVPIGNINLIISLVSILKENTTRNGWMSFQKDTCFYGRRRNHICLKELFFLHTLVGHRLSVIACSHIEDLIEIPPDITPIRCQNLPEYMTEGSEGESCKKCISFLDQ